MPPHPSRPGRHARSAFLLLALPLLLPSAARAADPDVPNAIHFEPGPAQSFLRRDLDRFATPSSLRLLLAGSAMALAVHGEESADRAEQWLDRPAFDGSLDLGNVWGNGATLGAGALGLYAAGALAGDPNLRGAGSEVARSLVYTGIAVTSLKMAVGRTRPNGGAWSFPSGHTAAAFAVAPVLAARFGPKVGIPAYALAVATGLGRMEDRKHYLSDVVAGAAIGMAVGKAVAGPNSHLVLGPSGAGVAISF
ncbi:MAG: phosphatase PAP2 family protein [Candidatus Eisenbacteria bacterium]